MRRLRGAAGEIRSKDMVHFGIIGTGIIAKKHIAAIGQAEHASAEAVCDVNINAANQFAREHGVKKVYADYQELLSDPAVEAVSICTPSGTHGEIVKAAARAGKHILCEKPIETTKAKIDDLIAVVESSGVKMQCVYQRRFLDGPQKAKELLASGRMGRLLMASAYLKYYRTPEYYRSAGWRATWEYDGGGCLMNQGVHGIDLLTWLTGGIKRVRAITDTRFHHIPVEDSAAVIAEYQGGAIGVIEGSTCAQPGGATRIELHCENGSICFCDNKPLRVTIRGETVEAASGTVGTADGHALLLEDLVRSIETGTPPAIGPREARKAIDAILAIYQASRENREILL